MGGNSYRSSRRVSANTVGPGVKHLSRTDSRPVTWVIKIKHAGLGVLGQKIFFKKNNAQATSFKQGGPAQ